jgi:hypothetical protein
VYAILFRTIRAGMLAHREDIIHKFISMFYYNFVFSFRTLYNTAFHCSTIFTFAVVRWTLQAFNCHFFYYRV